MAPVPAKHRSPVVSIVTPTWLRGPTLLRRLIPSLIAQTFIKEGRGTVEHVIVSDGLDLGLLGLLERQFPYGAYPIATKHGAASIQYRVTELGRNSSSLVTDSFGIAPNLVGTWLARGDYIVCVADDDVLFPEFLSETISFLEDAPEIGLVYTGFRHRSSVTVYDVQGTPPREGCVCSPVFRSSLLAHGGWQMHDGLTADWKMVQRWVEQDIPWGYCSDILMEHFADHV